MPYKVFYGDDDDVEFKEMRTEKNKDEVIVRLIWLLRQRGSHTIVEYPNGEIY